MAFDPPGRKCVATTCPYCGVGCGVLATPSCDGLSAAISGDPDHPANFGRLCSKGSALGETLDLDERLLHPEIANRRASWDDALRLVATQFSDTIAEHGPDSVAFYVSGQLLTEDYYVANKLMKGFIGSANIDTNSRLCMASSVVGHKRAFGADTVPGVYEDLELADLVVLVGSNFAWCHPVLHQRLMAAKAAQGTRIVAIDPRATATTQAADLHLAIKPGADVALFNALFAHLSGSSAFDADFVRQHTSGLDEALKAAGGSDFEALSKDTGLSIDDLLTFFEWVRETPKTTTIYSQGVNQSTAGSDKVNAILNCHLATGRIGKPGAGPFSITGQPNAMGGREVGGLANQLAAHMDFAPDDRDRVQRFWRSPTIAERPGLKAVDMFDAVADGRIKALWVMATNPAVSMPDADKVRDAIKACPFVVVSDVVATGDTIALADVKLPATAWGEKTGTVTNSERRISRQRAFLSPPGEARHDWAIIADVARRMGFEGFDYDAPFEVFREHARLSAFENNGARDFDIGAFGDVDAAQYDALTPVQWPTPLTRGGSGPGRSEFRYFANGGFFTSDRKARFLATPVRGPANAPDADYPLVLNTGRVRDHWHTMTRTAKAPRLSQHVAEPYVEISPADAASLGVAPAGLAELKSRWGRGVFRVLVSDRVRPGEVFAPMHWTARFASAGRVDALANPAIDPASGQPELKHTPVSVSAFPARWFAFLASVAEPRLEHFPSAYWVKARGGAAAWRTEIAGVETLVSDDDLISNLTAAAQTPCGGDALVLSDPASGRTARAMFDEDGRLAAVLILGPRPVAADRGWLADRVGTVLSDEERRIILSGRPPLGREAGRIVCACHGVGARQIEAAARAGASSVDALGHATCAGTNCGSCKPELQMVLDALAREVAAMKEAAE